MNAAKRACRWSAGATALVATLACAQTYPVKPVRFIAPAAPGGGMDLIARTLAQKLTESLGQQVVVDNRAGAAGNIGTALAAKAAPDGYTLVVAYSGTFAISPWIYRDPGYHPLRDFAQVCQTASFPLLGVVHPSLPVRNLKELAAFAKTHPKELTFGSAGASTQLTAELFQLLTATRMTHVPYKGTGPLSIDLIAGHISLAFSPPAALTAHAKSGRLRPVVVTGGTRLATLPDVPTSKEAGYPEFEVHDWFGASLPAGTPKEIVARLNTEIVRALRQPDVRERLTSVGLEPAGGTPEAFAAYVKAEYERWGEVVKKAGIPPQ